MPSGPSATDVLIIGGGILGCAAAYYLARRGFFDASNRLLVAPAFMRRAMEHGARLALHTRVEGIAPGPRGTFTVSTNKGPIEARRIVLAAGATTRAARAAGRACGAATRIQG